MPAEIQAKGFLGIAFEAVAGTYVAPTVYFPIESEGLTYQSDNQDRRLIRGIADRIGIIAGNVNIEGDIEMEALHDAIPYFLYASRNTVVKTGAGPYTYTCTPFHGAMPTSTRTLSITIVRNGEAFGYTGCVVGSMNFSTDAGVLKASYSVVGRDEGTQSVPTPTFGTSTPFGAGTYTISNPTATPVFDVDTFSLEIEDNATPEFRLSNTRGAQFVRFGEREVGLTMSRDFIDRVEYDTWKILTARSVTVAAASGGFSFSAKLPVAIKSSYEVSGLQSQGDLVRAEIKYEGIYDASTSKAYEIIVISSANIT